MEYARMLNGRRAVVLGGASGYGRAAAALFEAQGASVATIDSAVIAEGYPKGSYSADIMGDLSNANDVGRMCGSALEKLGGYADILVCAADLYNTFNTASPSSTEFKKIFDICVTSALICAKTVMPGMLEQRRGNIIVITTDLALSASPGTAAAAACSGALLAFSKNVSMDYIRYHVKSNCVLVPFNGTAGRRPLLGNPSFDDAANSALWYACDLSRNVVGDFVPVTGGANYFDASFLEAVKGGGAL